ncbi:fimbrial protein [Raoultella planticola]|uniref:fimbrial protein n=1 Tax=Raoultella planticola TaxID=575 RepID=UPI000AA39C21|nr:fimbrial protein [Raoultella planticola]EKW3527070.1 type 1 fimbrial protein [Raoultella planticola]ELF4969411.1 type 1 fimbrial protein [Raoultella planticola]MCD9605252.1 fimbrial protein [Raoultella planticola]MDM9658717.1 fimbrial protein [Raoultella planticola]MDM9663812.1 fimbrial protein [Raoultella planticola]
MRITPIKGFLALFLLWAGHSQATTITCVASTSWPAKAEVFTLNGIISVGEDTPVGTVVYRAQLWANNMGLDCRASADESIVGTTIYLPTRVEAISTPTSVVPGVTAPSTSEVVYETNVPGIGVSVTAAGKMPYVWQTAFFRPKYATGGGGNYGATFGRFEVQLIKTGPVSPGIINAINFPQVKVTFITPTVPAELTFIGFPVPYSTVSYNGTIQIVNSTCRTEVADKVVDLGSHMVEEIKNAPLQATTWTDASLRLIGCQFTPGFYNSKNTSIYHIGGTSNVGQGTPNANTVRLSLSASTSVIDSLNGIIALTPAADSATGIGIQIGVKEGTEIKPFNFNTNGVVFTPSSSESQSLEIPIFARYSATSSTITPGKANGAVVYTLNYY